MINFFRKSRKKFADEKQVSIYIRYAIGEILLVVVGILIALQINNWNEERKDRLKEIQLLEQLKEEYNSNLNQLNEKIKIRNAAIKSAYKLLKLIDNPINIIADSVLLNLGRSGYRPTFDPISNDLISSGKLSLIQNEKLKRLLTSWESNVLQLREEEQFWRQYVMNVRDPFLKRKNIARNLHNNFWENENAQLYLLEKNRTFDVPIGNSKRSVDYKEFLSDPELETVLSFAVSSNTVCNLESETLKRHILEILELINYRLDSE